MKDNQNRYNYTTYFTLPNQVDCRLIDIIEQNNRSMTKEKATKNHEKAIKLFKELESIATVENYHRQLQIVTDKNIIRLKIMYKYSKFRTKQYIEMADVSKVREIMSGVTFQK